MVNDTPRRARIRDNYEGLGDEGKIANTVNVEKKIKRIKIMVRTLLAEIEDYYDMEKCNKERRAKIP